MTLESTAAKEDMMVEVAVVKGAAMCRTCRPHYHGRKKEKVSIPLKIRFRLKI